MDIRCYIFAQLLLHVTIIVVTVQVLLQNFDDKVNCERQLLSSLFLPFCSPSTDYFFFCLIIDYLSPSRLHSYGTGYSTAYATPLPAFSYDPPSYCSDEEIEVEHVFAVTRPTEQLHNDDKARSLLYHASKPDNYLGILSR